MYFKKETAQQINFLASAKFVAFTTQVESAGVTANPDGRKIVPAGTILPANDATAKGILMHDTDVTEGPQAGSLIVEAYVIPERLPAAPAAEAITALNEIKFR